MSRLDIRNAVAVDQTIAPGNHTGGNSTGSGVDLANANAAAVLFSIGTVTDAAFTFAIEHAEDDGSGSPDTWEAVDTDDLEGDIPDLSAANTEVTVGYHGIRRHLRVVATDGGTGDANFGVSVLTHRHRSQPTS